MFYGVFLTSAKEVVFVAVSMCWFVSRITRSMYHFMRNEWKCERKWGTNAWYLHLYLEPQPKVKGVLFWSDPLTNIVQICLILLTNQPTNGHSWKHLPYTFGGLGSAIKDKVCTSTRTLTLCGNFTVNKWHITTALLGYWCLFWQMCSSSDDMTVMYNVQGLIDGAGCSEQYAK